MKKSQATASEQPAASEQPRVRILTSIASERWSFVPGDVVAPDSEYYADACALAAGENAAFLDADGNEYRVEAVVPPGTPPVDEPPPPKAEENAGAGAGEEA